MGKVFHSCGHEDTYRPVSGWPISLKEMAVDHFSGESRAVSHLTLCHSCYVEYITKYHDLVLLSPYEEWAYLSNNELD